MLALDLFGQTGVLQDSSSLFGGYNLDIFSRSHLARSGWMASIHSDDSSHGRLFKRARPLSLAFNADARSSSSFSAGPLTPLEDPSLDNDNFFLVAKKGNGERPPRLFAHCRSLSLVPDNPNLSLVADISSYPSSISSFDIIGTLGRGSYGKVLLGTHAAHPGLHAIKVLQQSTVHRYGLEEVERELRTLKAFNDVSKDIRLSFLQKLTCTFLDERLVFLVLEYHPTPLSDPEITSRLRLDGPVGITVSMSLPHSFPAVPTSQDAMSALHSLRLLSAELVIAILFLHEMGIIHQDLKPQNVMCSATGHIVIGDFGASSWMDNGRVVFHPTDVVTFTPLYAAPELMHRNAEEMVIVDSSVDWWSLGVMLYEFATGTAPFRCGESRTVGDFSCSFGEMEQVAMKGQDKEWWDPRLEDFIKALLVHDPRDRIRDGNVKQQEIFEPLSELWDEIIALAHPPLPPPSLRYLDSDVGLCLYDEEPSDIGRLPSDLPMDEDVRSVIHPIPSSASIYKFCTTVSDADDEFSDSPSSLDISKVVFTPLSDVALVPSHSNTSLDSDLDVGHAVVALPVIYKRLRTPSPSEIQLSDKLPFPSVQEDSGYADVTPPYVYKSTMTPTPSRYDIFSPRPDSSGRLLRRTTARRQLKNSVLTLEESLTISVLDAMQHRVTPKPGSNMSVSGSKKSAMGGVFKRLRKFSIRSAV